MTQIPVMTEENNSLNKLVAGVFNQLSEFKADIFQKFHKFEKKVESVSSSNKKTTVKDDREEIEDEDNKNDGKVFTTDDMWKFVVIIMSGIEISVRLADLDKRMFSNTDKDYTTKNTFEVVYPSLDGFKTAEFVDYAPFIFSLLRTSDRFGSEAYLESIGPEHLTKIVTGNSTTFRRRKAVENGLLEFMSVDRRLSVKEITRDQLVFFLSILRKYREYTDKEATTLLESIYGLHSITIKGRFGMKNTRHFVVSQNVVNTNALFMDELYSFKGSTNNRKTSVKNMKKYPLKEQNFLEQQRKLEIPPIIYSGLLRQIERDTQFLASCGIMNYSLLLGVHKRANRTNQSKNTMIDPNLKIYEHLINKIMFQNDPTSGTLLDSIKKYKILFTSTLDKIIFMGITDFLSPYTKKKKCEYALSKMIGKDDFSCAPPNEYKARFCDFLDKAVFHESTIDTDKDMINQVQTLLNIATKSK